ncbi:MAG: hypothetical protein JWO12_160 [Frankiales bacterium]|nr:hypothetical protein [Frankiales bacterium]
MLPTLNGRIQSRIVITLIIGGLWSLLIALFLPGVSGASYSDKLRALLGLLIVLTVLGIGWELVYHGLMQLRWEKDWPTLFGLVTIVNEGTLAYVLVVHRRFDHWWFHDDYRLPRSTFLFALITTWLVVWLWANGPMRVFTVHWRFRGGRFV